MAKILQNNIVFKVLQIHFLTPKVKLMTKSILRLITLKNINDTPKNVYMDKMSIQYYIRNSQKDIGHCLGLIGLTDFKKLGIKIPSNTCQCVRSKF